MDLDRTPPTQGLTQENPQLQTCSEPLKQPGEVHAGGGSSTGPCWCKAEKELDFGDGSLSQWG